MRNRLSPPPLIPPTPLQPHQPPSPPSSSCLQTWQDSLVLGSVARIARRQYPCNRVLRQVTTWRPSSVCTWPGLTCICSFICILYSCWAGDDLEAVKCLYLARADPYLFLYLYFVFLLARSRHGGCQVFGIAMADICIYYLQLIFATGICNWYL